MRDKRLLLVWAGWMVYAIVFGIRHETTNALIAATAATVIAAAGYIRNA